MSARKFSLSSMLLIREAKMVIAVKVGLCIVPFLLLYVPSALVFPYITGKVFAFRIAVAITCVLWVGLAHNRFSRYHFACRPSGPQSATCAVV